jgi:hypothetical protein
MSTYRQSETGRRCCAYAMIGALYYYIADYDPDGLIDVGSTTQIESEPRAPIAHVIEFSSRATQRGDQFREKVQKMYDEAIQIASKNFGE